MSSEYLTPRRRRRASPRAAACRADLRPRRRAAHRGEVDVARVGGRLVHPQHRRAVDDAAQLAGVAPRRRRARGGPRSSSARAQPLPMGPAPQTTNAAAGAVHGAERVALQREEALGRVARVACGRAASARRATRSSTSGTLAKRQPARARAQPEVVVLGPVEVAVAAEAAQHLRAHRHRGMRERRLHEHVGHDRVVVDERRSSHSHVGAHARRCAARPRRRARPGSRGRRRRGRAPAARACRASRSGRRRRRRPCAPGAAPRAARRGRVQRRHQPAAAACARTRTRGSARGGGVEERRGCRRASRRRRRHLEVGRVCAKSEARHSGEGGRGVADGQEDGDARGQRLRAPARATNSRASRTAFSRRRGPPPRRTGPPPPAPSSASRRAPDLRLPRGVAAHRPRISYTQSSRRRVEWMPWLASGSTLGEGRAARPRRPRARSASRLSGGMNRNSTP